MLTRIYIKNFKGIKDTTVNCEKDYNVFIGENNVGKTTIFEAIHLWKRCYDLNVKKKNDGFYASAKNILFKNLETIRVIHDRDIFPLDLPKNELECTISLTFEIDKENFELGFIISKPTSIDDAYLQINYANSNEFSRFATKIASLHSHNVSNVISINESRPVANIIANEPKMTTAEIKDKIAKGKSHEVLRNKILSNEVKIADHIEAITGERPDFWSTDKKAYIEMKVNDKDILSFDSGFIQLVELFSSIEYSDSLIKILLIDEPDAHIHVKTQRQLVSRLQGLTGYQLFIISHNERFVNETQDTKLFHIQKLGDNENVISHINPSIRPLLIEGLTGIVNDLDEWKTAQKVILVEGSTDESMLKKLLEKYHNVTSTKLPTLKFYKLNGIDYLYSKLEVLTRAMDDIIPNKKWLLIRDADCYPISRIPYQKEQFKNPISRNIDFDIYFQEGYGIESTYMTQPDLLAQILQHHYTKIDTNDIEKIIRDTNIQFEKRVKDSSHQIYKDLKEKHFDRQSEVRKKIYNGVTFDNVLNEITSSNIQYIMTKEISKLYYEEIHTSLLKEDPNLAVKPLSPADVENLYLDHIKSTKDIFECHINMINNIKS